MHFNQIIGQSQPKEILSRALQNNRVPHAYLFHGMRGVGKEALALQLAQALLCTKENDRPCYKCSNCKRISRLNHPDVPFIFPAPANVNEDDARTVIESFVQQPYLRRDLWANPTIGINRIRELRRSSALKPLEGRGRVVIITEVEKMTTEASNALLKILEEPPVGMTMILITSNINALLSTIVSRCQEVRFELLGDDDIESTLINRYDQNPETARLIARLSLGSFRRALELLEEELTGKREMVIDIFRGILKDSGTRMALVEKLAAERDKRLVKELLGLTLIWLRDAMILHCSTNSENNSSHRIINADQLETLIKFSNAYDHADYESAISEVEQAIKLIDRNIFLNLVLLVLFNNLNQHIQRKTI
jgi:DNA polymerase-3 subunit delta'